MLRMSAQPTQWPYPQSVKPSIWKLVSLKSSKDKRKSSLCLTKLTKKYLKSWLIYNSTHTQTWIFKATPFTPVLCTLVSQKTTPTNQQRCHFPSNQKGTCRAVSFRTSGTTERKFCCCSTWWKDMDVFRAPSKWGPVFEAKRWSWLESPPESPLEVKL